jgi:hypothetical protein
MKNQLAFQLKLKLTTKQVGYKPSFISGIVLANNQVDAVQGATEQIIEAIRKEPIKVEVKLQSVVKLRRDFFIIIEPKK